MALGQCIKMKQIYCYILVAQSGINGPNHSFKNYEQSNVSVEIASCLKTIKICMLQTGFLCHVFF